MVIAYDKRDGAATFAALAAMLENYARLAEKAQADNGDTSAKAIARCVAAMPDTEPLCTTFGKAVECADNAHDEELKADLTKRARKLTECWAQGDIGAYVTLLRRQAAYFQAVSDAIGANGTRTDVTGGETSELLKGIAEDTRASRVAAERAASGTSELAAELVAWREWVRDIATKPKSGNRQPPLCATIQRHIVECWAAFNETPPDCEMPDGKLRTKKRTYAECLCLFGDKEIWKGQTLKELVPDTNAFERIVHNQNEQKRQRCKIHPATPPQARRKA